MLRRIADNLFWVGRNLERAEWRARLVDVNYHLLIETPPRDSAPWEPLLAIFGEIEQFAKHHSIADEASVLDFFTHDPENPNSIKSCIAVARNNLRSLRHYVSSEYWLDVNTLYLASQNWTPEVFVNPGVYAFFSDLRDCFYRISGIRHTTLPRDLAYDFLRVGIMVERAEEVSRMLDVKYHFLMPRLEDIGGAADLLQWAGVLRSASSLEAYRKRFGNAIKLDNVIDILLFDPTFPRSARYSIESLENSLRRIASRGEMPGVIPRGVTDLMNELQREKGSEAIQGGLHEFLLHIQESTDAISNQIYDMYLKVE
ncbi:MAG TPA: alpha-E domain-containing protein [Candidatus Binataceae bacterium]|nr:alpha-E domain-containing protein [Candidatus Binataceae bacterium]